MLFRQVFNLNHRPVRTVRFVQILVWRRPGSRIWQNLIENNQEIVLSDDGGRGTTLAWEKNANAKCAGGADCLGFYRYMNSVHNNNYMT